MKGRRNFVAMVIALLFMTVSTGYGQTTWYSYQDGDWSNPAVWTTDGSAFPLYVNPSSLLPGPTDEVVITNGKKVTVQSTDNNQRTVDGGDDDQSIDLANLEVIGQLDLAISSGHSFTNIEGTGIIYLQGDGSDNENFPTYTTNTFFASDGGTLTIEGNGMDLDQAETYGNLEIALDNSSDIVTLLNDVTIDGNLTLTQGVFQFNDATNAVQQNLTVNSDVTVSANSSMTVGTGDPQGTTTGYGNYHNYFHLFTVNGSLTNNGTINFDNLTNPDYDTRTTTGGVSLVFSGSTNESLTCNNTTDLYYLVISKGTDQTYSLTINASSKAYFSLFGDNNQAWDNTDAANPEMRKALWISAGTLILEGNVFIPSVTEGGSFWSIGENAGLNLNGANVYFSTTALTTAQTVWAATDFSGLSHAGTPDGVEDASRFGQGLYLFGTLEVNDGTFATTNSSGFLYRAEATANRLEINGGTLLLDHFRISNSASSATAKMSYIQTGGEVHLIKEAQTHAMFDLSAQLGTFTMSGGDIYIEDLSAGTPSAVEIGCSASNINVTGGNIYFNVTGEIHTVTTNAPFYNIILENGTLDFSQDIEIINSLTLNAGTLDMNSNNLSIGKDFTIASGVTLTALNNITFDGSASSRIFNNTNASITIPNDLIVNKSDATKSLTIETSDDGDDGFTISGQLNVTSGNFDYDFQTVTVDNINVADTIGTTTSTGNITLSAASTITSTNGVMHRINSSNSVSLTGDMTIDGPLTLTTSVFDINTSKLTIGPNGSISGTFSTTNMIRMDGNQSDGGLEMYINANANYIFPIGTDANATTRYTPVDLDMSANISDDGYVQINIADEELSTLATSGGSLTYFWRFRHRDFSNTTNIITDITMDFADSDGDDGSVDNNDNYFGGYVLDEAPYSREDLDNECDYTNNQLIFDGDLASSTGVKDFDLIEASYTAGPTNAFNGTVDIFYSRQDGDWNTNTTWADDSHSGAAITGGQCCPGAGDVVIIGFNGTDNHVITTTTDIQAGILDFNSMANASTKDGNMSRLSLDPGEDLTVSSMKGIGEVHLVTNGTTIGSVVSTSDIGDFVANTGSTFIYDFGSGTGPYTITAYDTYPTVRFYADAVNSSASKSEQFLLDRAISAQNVMIDGNASLLLDQNLTITDSLWIGNEADGELMFDNGATAVTVTVEDILMETTNGTDTENINLLTVEAGGANTTEHRLQISGNLTLRPGSQTDTGADIDLTTAANNNVILEFTGSGTHSFDKTSITNVPDLYRLEIDKGTSISNTLTINTDYNLEGPTNGTTKALQLDNGLLILNDAGITATLSSGGADFSISSTAGLELQDGDLTLNGSDLSLNGLIRISGSGASLDMSGAENNLIYGTTGSAQIDISNGSLTVGGQLRRETSNTSGVLAYSQSAGTVSVGTDGASESSRGIFEIANNAGSSFTLSGGSLTLYRDNGASPTTAALFLDPASSSITGTPSIIIGHTSVSPANAITINSSVTLPSLSVTEASGVTAQLLTQGLTLSGDLNIGTATTGETFNANGLSLTIGGDLNNFGTYTANGNTLIFNGSTAQAITGTGSETIFNLTYSGTNTLSLSNDITVSNDLSISSSSGTISTGTNTLDVSGDVLLEGNITSISGNGLRFSGSADQNLTRTTSGMSSIGIMTINNGNEVDVPDGSGYEFEITGTLNLTSGVFNIGGNLLEFDEDATISGTFSASNMIKTNNAFLDNGVRKILPSTNNAALSNFVIPVGEVLYTPVTLDISDSGTGGANKYITVRPANEAHPSVANNATTLAYYWVVKSANISDMSGDLVFQYIDPTHISGTESNYLPGRLLTTSSTWDKAFTVTDVDDALNTITFSLTTEDSNEIEGEYTAGEDAGIGANVETISTTGSGGNFSSTLTWNGGTVPSNGAIITIATGATLTMDTDNRRFLRTEIQSGATLDMSTSTGQSVGTVTGTGDIRISSASFPNGDYTSFFTCSGGGIQYEGSTDYAILASISDIRNITLSGTGERQLPANDINICEDLTLSGANLINNSDVNVTIGDDLILNTGTIETGANTIWNITDQMDINGGTFTADNGSQIDVAGITSFDGGTFNAGSATLNLSGNLTRTSGTFTAGTSEIVMTGTAAQSITGDFTTANSSSLNNLTINKSSNNVTISSDVDITNNLNLTDGNFITNVSDIFRLGLTATSSNASNNSFVQGPLYKTLDNSANDNFMFPVGSGSFYARAGVNNSSTVGDWYAEYVASIVTSGSGGDDNDLPVGGRINKVSYWNISGPNSATANVTLSLDGFDVSGNSGDWNDMRVMMYDNVTDNQWEMQGDADGSDDTEKTVTGTVASSFSVHEFTLGSVSADNPLPVELISFEAQLTDKGVLLEWSTASEINNDYFEVERSSDGIHFSSIGTLSGSGTTNELIQYGFTDDNPFYGISYYRLVQYDYDGTQAIFEAIIVNNDQYQKGIQLRLFPNPTNQHNINVRIASGDENTPVQLMIFDLTGHLIHSQMLQPRLGISTHAIKVSSRLDMGVYQILIQQANNRQTQRLIIK